ncbi:MULTISPECIES: hypothetical protein [Bacillaceae]|uniref:hypothetical protein n=1 Tax=Bacillaceae TaxID=186817 RepID=UPI0023563545|nr:hypothetical protein [Bacillus weihaiensis]
MNYYVIDLDGREVVTAKSPNDRFLAMKRIATMISPKAVAKRVSYEAFKLADSKHTEGSVLYTQSDY